MVKCGVKFDLFLFDDGWDDCSGSWYFSKDFLYGFVLLCEVVVKYGVVFGMWLLFWGGYGLLKEEWVKNGCVVGYEIIDGGLVLFGLKYYQCFYDVMMELLCKDGINQFKFDGIGNVDKVFLGSCFFSDFDVVIVLIDDLCKVKLDLFINFIIGILVLLFWLCYVDLIWCDGEDDWYVGVGIECEWWIIYCDCEIYCNIVEKGLLFLFNLLMFYGIIYVKENYWFNIDFGYDFVNEVYLYFGSGIQLQELYIMLLLFILGNWDMLVEVVKWLCVNVLVFKDIYWVGGDFGWLDVYGWVVWVLFKVIFILCNFSDKL